MKLEGADSEWIYRSHKSDLEIGCHVAYFCWVLGSGMIERAAKQFKARFAGPGMRWSRHGAERLLPVRAAILGKQFDRLWASAYNSPQNVMHPH